MIDPKVHFSFTPVARDNGFSAEWRVPDELPYFEGHFPGNPVLPAIAIIDATVELIRQAAGSAELSGVKSAKFASPVTPGMRLEILVHLTTEKEWTAEWKNLALPEAEPSVAQLTLRLGL